jgi:hypothetical protein
MTIAEIERTCTTMMSNIAAMPMRIFVAVPVVVLLSLNGAT